MSDKWQSKWWSTYQDISSFWHFSILLFPGLQILHRELIIIILIYLCLAVHHSSWAEESLQWYLMLPLSILDEMTRSVHVSTSVNGHLKTIKLIPCNNKEHNGKEKKESIHIIQHKINNKIPHKPIFKVIRLICIWKEKWPAWHQMHLLCKLSMNDWLTSLSIDLDHTHIHTYTQYYTQMYTRSHIGQ